MDTLSAIGPVEGAYYSESNPKLLFDFENLDILPELHHELTHALQYQQGSITSKHQLNEIDAFLNQAKYIQQAKDIGVPMRQRNIDTLYDYQKYNDDIGYIEKSLYPQLYHDYDHIFQSDTPIENIASKDDFKAYALSLGTNEAEAEAFAQTLTQKPEEEIKYKLDHDNEEVKITRRRGLRDELHFYEELEEHFNTGGRKTKTVKTFINEDVNKNIIKTIETEEGSNKTTQRYFNGVLEEPKEPHSTKPEITTQDESSVETGSKKGEAPSPLTRVVEKLNTSPDR